MLRFLFCFSILAVSSPTFAADSYSSYTNPRYGFVVVYPSNLLRPQPETANGAGRRFVSLDGKIKLMGYATEKRRDRPFSGVVADSVRWWQKRGARLTYQKAGKNWFVLSGFRGKEIFYQKTIARGENFQTLLWEYPVASRKRLDAAVTRSSTAFGASYFPPRTPKPSPAAQPTSTPMPDVDGY